ncbi:MAG: hypothetical protein D6798_02380, partial [Deltaproteobacteria bacterium]
AALLRRLSLDLRGSLPTEAELEAVEQGTDPLSLVDDFMADPRFEERMVQLLAERWRTRVDAFNLDWEGYGIDPLDAFAFNRSIGEEAPRVAARVIAEDRPWADVVTGDATMADALLLDIYPLAPDAAIDDAHPWVPARWLDGRPPLGVLATNGFWLRYDTSPSNLNRRRANAVSTLFLCEDFLARPISFSSAAFPDADAMEDATRSVPACISCHSTLDPLASALMGYWWFDRVDPSELTTYHAERETLGTYYLDTGPEWFGTPLDSIDELGPMMAADPRFQACAAETFAELFLRRELDEVGADHDLRQALQQRYDATGGSPQALIAAVLSTDEYRAGDASGPQDLVAERATRRLLSPSQLAQVIEELTGFSWTWEGYDQLDNDVIGYRILAGGIDGDTVVTPLSVPTMATTLLVRRLAQAGASEVVRRDLEGDEGRLLDRVGLDDRPGDERFDAQLRALHRRLYSESATDEELAAEAELWTAVNELDGPAAAWRSLLTVLMRDPRFWTT